MRARQAAATRAGALILVLPVAGCALLDGAVRPPHDLGTDCATGAVVGLRWTPGSRGAVHRISRDGAVVGETRSAGFVDTSIDASTTYRYVVSALGRAGESADSAPLVVVTAPAAANGDAPYCPSTLVNSLTWHFQQATRRADGSDLWPVTWGSDGNVYAFFGDGGGFGGDDHRGRTSFGIAKIVGPPPPADSPEHNLYGGYESPYASLVSGKARSIVALGSDFYAIAGIYRDTDDKSGRAPPISDSPPHVEVVYSMHDAHSWHDGSWTFCDDEQHGDFCASSFVNFGPGGRGAPDRYVYILGTSPAADRRLGGPPDRGRTYLARVPRRRVLSQARYEYFFGLDGKSRPQWTSDSRRLQPIFQDGNPSKPGCGGVCPMAMTLQEAVYDFGLKRFIGVAQGRYMAQTSFYEAVNPWGPWRTLSYDNIDPVDGHGGWAGLGVGAGESLGVHVVNAWTSADGTTLWMVYSSDGIAAAEAQFPPPGTKLDAFHLVEATMTLADQGGSHAR